MSICKKFKCEDCSFFTHCGGCEKHCATLKDGQNQCICVRIIKEKGFNEYQNTVQKIIEAVNALKIQGLQITDVNVIPGAFINLEYPLPSGNTARFICNDLTYFANQVDINDDRFYGVVSDGTFILVTSYGCDGVEPELVAYKKL